MQVGSLPVTNLLHGSLEESEGEPQLITKQTHDFPFWVCGKGNPVHALGAFDVARTDASVLILFSQRVLSV